jgi:hypothetical protein
LDTRGPRGSPGDRWAYRWTMLRVRHPNSWTARKSTPAATRQEAKVCRSVCHVTPSSWVVSALRLAARSEPWAARTKARRRAARGRSTRSPDPPAPAAWAR